MSNYIGYKPEDNARRKANNTGDSIPTVGKNQNVKCLSTKPGQLSMKEQAAFQQMKLNRLNKKQPVRSMNQFSDDELKAMQAKYGCMKKGA
jgi:hypothetical protein